MDADSMQFGSVQIKLLSKFTSKEGQMKSCLLFPGQGAQAIGMGKDLFEANKKVKELFEEASDITKMDLTALIFSGTEEELKQTRNTQVALALVDYAAGAVLHEAGFSFAGTAGFSLGEWPSLVEAGVLGFDAMMRLVAERGRLMDEAGKRSGGSTMSAVLALEPEKIEAALKAAGIDDVWVANYNSASQCVISGTESGIVKAEEVIKAAGAKRVIRLKVSGAFHSPIMQYAYDGFKEFLQDVSFKDPVINFYSNVTGGKVSSGAELKKYAADQIISPVRWTQEEAAMQADGYTRMVEAGPGNVLCGLWKTFNADVPAFPCGTLELIQKLEK